MKLSNGLLSFLITVACYVLFFGILSTADGDESNNPIIAAGTFFAMTFFINFPIAWFVIFQIVKGTRNKK